MANLERFLRVRFLLIGGYLLLWPPFLLLLSYTSYEPTVFGRWSSRLFIAIAGYAVFLALVSVAAVVGLARGDAARGWIGECLGRLRRRRMLLSLACAAPVVGWLIVVFAAAAVGPPASIAGRVQLGLLDLALLVATWLLLLLLAEREPREQRAVLVRGFAAGLGLVGVVTLAEIAGHFSGVEPRVLWRLNPPNADVIVKTDEFESRVRTNEQGLREVEPIEPPREGVFRVVVIGDSITFGREVNDDQTYPAVAQRLLQVEHGQTGIELINVSRAGAGPAEYLHYIRRYAAALRPDLIIVGFYTLNDCPIQQPFERRTSAQLEALGDNLKYQDRGQWWEHSFVCRLLSRRILALARPPGVATRSSGDRDPLFQWPNPLGLLLDADQLDEEQRVRLERLRSAGWIEKGLSNQVDPGILRAALLRPNAVADVMFLRAETREAMRAEWELCRLALSEMAAASSELEAPLWVLVIPHGYQVDRRCVARLEEWGCLTSPEMIGSRILNDLVAEHCVSTDVPALDPMRRFRELTEGGEALFYASDSHLTPRGHRVLAELLVETLRAHRSPLAVER